MHFVLCALLVVLLPFQDCILWQRSTSGHTNVINALLIMYIVASVVLSIVSTQAHMNDKNINSWPTATINSYKKIWNSLYCLSGFLNALC